MFFDYKNLEFKKIIEIIKTKTASNYAKVLLDDLTPSFDYEEVLLRNNNTEEARVFQVKYASIPLGGLNDIKNLIKKIELNAILSAREVLDISVLLYCSKNVINYYKDIKKECNIKYLNFYFDEINQLDSLSKKINLIIDDSGSILDTASSELFRIRKSIKNLEIDIKAKMQDIIASKSSMLTDNMIVFRNDRMCLCVKESHKNSIKGIIHDESQTKTTFYIEPYVISDIYNKINHLKSEQQEEIKRILTEISNEIYGYVVELNSNFYNLSMLDFYYGIAKYAIDTNSFMPNINTYGVIDLVKARHPLLNPNECVPLDIKLGETYQAIIITGPNTGGKTVALKTVGLLTIMMQCGILVPASHKSSLSIFDNVYADIGDEQSIEQSLSSFSSHMTNVIKIINTMSINSLILLDELGSGTDPKEGSNLAIAIIDFMVKRNARIICTTHYADLKAYAYDKDEIINASVEFDIESLRPTYRLLLGVPGASNAIIIAQKLGLDSRIIEFANSLDTTLDNDVSTMMKKLDAYNNELLIKEKEYNKLNFELTNLKKKYENKVKHVEDSYNSEIKKAKAEAIKIIEKAKSDASDLIKELSTLQESGVVRAHEVAKAKHSVSNLLVEDVKENKEVTNFKVGQYVMVDSYQKLGIVMKIKKDIYTVKLGNIEMDFKATELSKSEVVAKNNTTSLVKKKNLSTNTVNKEFKLELDLRGYRYEEVHEAVDKFIDSAYLAGLGQISIIHGFGTGVVRKAVYDYLKKCPYVKSTRYGGENEGLNGVTIVSLK